jgi:diketogulonate reductase-like aldo/keto reductase
MDRREVLAAGIAASIAAATGVAGTSKLITRKIPSSGEAIPVIGLGTSGPFEVGESEEERAPLRAVLNAFFSGGARVLDTSPMYSTAEDVLGDLLTPAQHQQVFLATKVWTQGQKAGIEQMERSLSLLKQDKLDLIQVHNLMDLPTQLATLRKWKEEGRVRYTGVTHFTVASHAELAKVISKEKIDFVQLNYSVFTRDAEKRLLPLARDKGVGVLVNRPYEDGVVFRKVREKPVPKWAADFGCHTWAQIFLKYIIAHPAVTVVIPATGKLQHIKDNLEAGSGELPNAKQRAQIVKAIAAV